MILSTFGIVLGVATILAISITNQTALESVKRLFSDTAGKANLIVTTAESDASGLSENILKQVQDIPGIAFAVPSVHINTLLADEAGTSEIGLSFFGTDIGGLTLYGIDPILDLKARDYKITEGSFLSEDPTAIDVVLVENYADDNDILVGKSIEIVTENGIEKLRVIGLMAKEGPGQLNNGSFGIIPLATSQKYFYRSNELDQIDIVVEPGFEERSNLDQIKSLVQQRLGEEYSVIYPASQG
jgi:ABC-type lipoprotein release transport system permease subunit